MALGKRIYYEQLPLDTNDAYLVAQTAMVENAGYAKLPKRECKRFGKRGGRFGMLRQAGIEEPIKSYVWGHLLCVSEQAKMTKVLIASMYAEISDVASDA